MPTLLQRLKLRHKLAALSVVGVAMCILPLAQVLRYQGLEIDRARTAEQGLDPALLAVSLQRGLLGHRDAAGLVLRGHVEAESQRRERQTEVDVRLAQLDRSVYLQGPQRAAQETQALRSDWLQMLQRLVARSLSVDASDAAHRLLVEQTLQVIDLVASLPPDLQDLDSATAALAGALAAPLPHLTASLLALQGPAVGPPRIAAAEAEAERTLLALDGAGNTALADSVAAARASLQEHLRLLREAGAPPAARAGSGARALQAHLALMAAGQSALQQQRALRVRQLQQQRLRGLLLIGALALLAAGLSVSVLRAARRLERAAAQPSASEASVTDGQWPLRDAMRWLMSRARQPAAARRAADERSENEH
jgi:hypothetical protein